MCSQSHSAELITTPSTCAHPLCWSCSSLRSQGARSLLCCPHLGHTCIKHVQQSCSVTCMHGRTLHSFEVESSLHIARIASANTIWMGVTRTAVANFNPWSATRSSTLYSETAGEYTAAQRTGRCSESAPQAGQTKRAKERGHAEVMYNAQRADNDAKSTTEEQAKRAKGAQRTQCSAKQTTAHCIDRTAHNSSMQCNCN